MPSFERPTDSSRPRAVTWRAVLLCVVLLPVNALWLVDMEVVRNSTHPTTLSLFFHVVFVLLCLVLVNRLVGRIAPRARLSQGELLLGYAVLSVGSAVAGHDLLESLVPILTYSFRNADGANEWATRVNPLLRPGLFVSDPAVYAGYYLGGDSVWRAAYLRAWLPVVLAWTVFIGLLLLVMQCFNALIRRQWMDHEKLTFPVVQLPLEITRDQAFAPGGLFRSKLFWTGFAVAGGLDMVNSLNFYFPNIPPLGTPGGGLSAWDLSGLITAKPWNDLGMLNLSYYPFVIGLGMLMPTDFLLSVFVFYWLWKLQKVLFIALAYDQTTRFPFIENQAFGAYLSFCATSLWLSRGYLREVWKRVWNEPSTLDDAGEPMRYRTAALGAVGGTGALVAFGAYLGLTWWVGVLFFAIYFALALAITRMRAELGTPVHDLHFTGPEAILTRVAGTRAFASHDLAAMGIFFWFNRAYRSHPMPHQLEAFHLAANTGGEYKRWSRALLGLGTLAVFVSFWAFLHLMYRYGAANQVRYRFGGQVFNNLSGWLSVPRNGEAGELGAIFVGFGIALALQWLRVSVPWWPLHPLAFAVTSSWQINFVWLPLGIAWIAKTVILRYAGLRGFIQSLPFFFGLMLGQFVVGCLWNVVGTLLRLPTYQFWD